jgi:hypothetical protein
MVGNAFQLMLASISEGETGPGHEVLHRLKRGLPTAQLSRPSTARSVPSSSQSIRNSAKAIVRGRSMSLPSRSDLLGQNQHQECHGQSHQIMARSLLTPPTVFPRLLSKAPDQTGGQGIPGGLRKPRSRGRSQCPRALRSQENPMPPNRQTQSRNAP